MFTPTVNSGLLRIPGTGGEARAPDDARRRDPREDPPLAGSPARQPLRSLHRRRGRQAGRLRRSPHRRGLDGDGQAARRLSRGEHRRASRRRGTSCSCGRETSSPCRSTRGPPPCEERPCPSSRESARTREAGSRSSEPRETAPWPMPSALLSRGRRSLPGSTGAASSTRSGFPQGSTTSPRSRRTERSSRTPKVRAAAPGATSGSPTSPTAASSSSPRPARRPVPAGLPTGRASSIRFPAATLSPGSARTEAALPRRCGSLPVTCRSP